jgi:hypothetical protein
VKIPRSRPARTAALREFRGLKFSRLPPYSYNTHGLPNPASASHSLSVSGKLRSSLFGSGCGRQPNSHFLAGLMLIHVEI